MPGQPPATGLASGARVSRTWWDGVFLSFLSAYRRWIGAGTLVSSVSGRRRRLTLLSAVVCDAVSHQSRLQRQALDAGQRGRAAAATAALSTPTGNNRKSRPPTPPRPAGNGGTVQRFTCGFSRNRLRREGPVRSRPTLARTTAFSRPRPLLPRSPNASRYRPTCTRIRSPH